MKNEYEIRGEITAIFLNRRDGTRLETIIDTENLSKIKDHTWIAALDKKTKSYYVQCNTSSNSTFKLHRFLFNNPNGFVIDHINHDTLNNTKANLRAITIAQNAQNKKGAQSNSESGIRGVSFNKMANKWHARVVVNYRKFNLGYFDDIKEAEKAVIEGRKKYMPYSMN